MFFVTLGIIPFIFGMRDTVLFVKYASYPKQEAILLSSHVEFTQGPSGPGASPCVTYRYNIAGKEFSGNRIYSLGDLFIGGASSGVVPIANKVLDKITNKNPLVIKYNPENPGFAFIYNGPLF